MNGYKYFKLTSDSTGSVVMIILVFTLMHGLLFGFDLANDTSLLSGDRSTSRNATISYVFNVEKIGDKKFNLDKIQASDSAPHIGHQILKSDFNSRQASDSAFHMENLGDRMLSSGHVGDYLIQGAVLALSNRHMLVVLQVALTLISTLCFFALLKHLDFSASTATLSTLLYLVLPGSLLPAHQLGTEALCISSLIIACYLLVISSEKKGIDILFVTGLLALSLAIFVRPQLILFPFFLFIIYFCFSAKKFNTVFLTVLPLSLLFSAVWMVVVFTNNGHFSLGGSDRSIGRSFHDTAEQMAMTGDFEFDASAYKSRTMPFVDFADIVADHTSSYLRQRTLSMLNFTVNSGAYSLAVRHLKFFAESKGEYYWQHLRARSGIYESIVEILKRGPGFTVLIIGSTLAWCFVLLFAVVGLSRFIKDKKTNYFAKVLLLTLVAYQVGIVMLISVGARWQHRSLLDFIIVLLAIYGLKSIQHYINSRKLTAVT